MNFEQESNKLEKINVGYSNGEVPAEILEAARQEYRQRTLGANVLPLAVEVAENGEQLAS